jgi:ATP-binding cassette subfamily F protein 3
MSLISLSQVSQQFDGRPILQDLTLNVDRGARIGLIGRNGSGKSTLLRILGRELEPSDGRVDFHGKIRVGHQAQELRYAPGATILDEMRAVFRADLARDERLRELEEALAEDPEPDRQKKLLGEYERLQREHDASGTYDVGRRIETVLSSLGLPQEGWSQEVDRFSGGERNVIGLARVLLSAPDVMLLDEPSNHLDMEGVEWFADFLRTTRAAVVMVSHNRHLLDETCDRIWELHKGGVKSWAGNYSAYRKQKADALALQERQFKTQKKLIERIEFQARRLRDMANAYDDPGQARRAKAMLKRIERMDKVDRPETATRSFRASLRASGRHGRIALTVNDFTFAYGDRTLFDHANLEIEFGDRVCLVGPNGSGKTTLFRQILDTGGWENETLRLGKAVKVGEYRQLHDVLDHAATLQDWAARTCSLTRSAAADLLHRFQFTRDDLDRRIETLSGGEKSRLQLARLVNDEINLLLLDEPTNHLDIEACEQLEGMLQNFPGTLFVISHDRYFLDELVRRVVEVRDGGLQVFPGTFEEWWEKKRQSRRRGALELRSRKAAADETKEAAKQEREEKKARQRDERKLRKNLSGLETKIESLETREEELKAELEEAYAAQDHPGRTRNLNEEFQRIRDEIRALYREWEAVVAALEE